MNAKRKSMLAGSLGALAAVVWAPQFFGLDAPEARARPELSAEIGGDGPSAADAVPQDPGASSRQPDALGSRLDSLEECLSKLDRPTVDLAGLLSRLEAPGVRPEGGPPAPVSPHRGDEAERLAEFAAQHPLTGLIHGPDRKAALLGHHVVRSGDMLLAGAVTVEEIGPGWVRLGAGEASLVLELPAFRARGRTPLPDAPQDAASAEAPASPATQAPAATPGAPDQGA